METIFGGNGDDIYHGGDEGIIYDGRGGNDSIAGGSGDDILYGGVGDDTLSGHSGADTLEGGEGNDVLYGDGGDDTLSNYGPEVLRGGAGGDRLYVWTGNDTLEGGDGNDTLAGTYGSPNLYGGNGDDVLDGFLSGGVRDGGDGADTIVIGSEDEYIVGGAGSDVFEFGFTMGGDDTIADFDPLVDTIDMSALPFLYEDLIITQKGDHVRITGETFFQTGHYHLNLLLLNIDIDQISPSVLTMGTSPRYDDQTDKYIGLESNDSYNGGAGNDDIYGFAGNDILKGDIGRDFLDGGSGDDTLLGGDGNDTIVGGSGTDFIGGGKGSDTFVFLPAWNHAIIEDFDVNTDTILFDDIPLGGNFSIAFASHDEGTLIQDNSGNTILLEGVSATEFSSDSYIIYHANTRYNDVREFSLVSPTGNQNIDGLLMGTKYAEDTADSGVVTLTYSFPDADSIYVNPYSNLGETGSAYFGETGASFWACQKWLKDILNRHFHFYPPSQI